MNAPKWLKFIKDAWDFDAKVQAAQPVAQKAQIMALQPVSVVDASDATSAAALATVNKMAINNIIAALKA
jgi:hypothetical protein